MKSLTFKVSAKTARLFGRESVSNAEAAIIELIKNTYDADATTCLLGFLPKYPSAPTNLTEEEYKYLYQRDQRIEQYYLPHASVGAILRSSDPKLKQEASSFVRGLVDIWIIDNGSGMTAQTIEECWMVIGTNDKEMNVVSRKGRARAGAKGIGRFALDRLGERCRLYSTACVDGTLQSIRWEVDWREFDEDGKVLDDISARMDTDGQTLDEVLNDLKNSEEIGSNFISAKINGTGWNTGTAIQISLLRDEWTRRDVDQLYNSLGALVPPLEQRELDLFLLDASQPDSYGAVSSAILEDFDYKLEARILDGEKIFFDLYRNELDCVRIDPELFERDEMKDKKFCRIALEKGKISYCRNLEELFPGEQNDFSRKVRELGPFDVQLRFFKKGKPGERDAKIYPYRQFLPGPRKAWLEEFGGIKIFRDNFAVRPYGEVNGRAFDWLALGKRVATSPVAASRKGWKVSPQNLAGTVLISREANTRLNDQTNREGIIENEHFEVFRTIILKVISEFEDDRSHIHFNLNELFKSKHATESSKEESAVIAPRIIENPKVATKEDAQALAHAFVAQQDEIRELKDEQIMLRALATLGTVLISFSHEMGQLQNTMGSRSLMLERILKDYISEEMFADVLDAFNPFCILSEWKSDDERVKQWFTFALTTLRAGRRRRRAVSLRDHLRAVQTVWQGFLSSREVKLTVNFQDEEFDPQVLAFEIDLDSIFNNLILNSIEAFLSHRHIGDRRITIGVKRQEQWIRVNYRDSGPGIHPSIRQPNQIFQFATSTKSGPAGDRNGTGLGMWILGSVVKAYGGKYEAIRHTAGRPGFHLTLSLPLHRGEE